MSFLSFLSVSFMQTLSRCATFATFEIKSNQQYLIITTIIINGRNHLDSTCVCQHWTLRHYYIITTTTNRASYVFILYVLQTAVRFGRVPKREKAKILAAMQKVNANHHDKDIRLDLEDELKLINIVVSAHKDTCDYTKERIMPLIERARNNPIYAQCPSQSVSVINNLLLDTVILTTY